MTVILALSLASCSADRSDSDAGTHEENTPTECIAPSGNGATLTDTDDGSATTSAKATTPEPTPIKVPIPEKIALGEIVVRAEPFVQLPQTGDLPARVRFLAPLHDGSGRLAIIDQEGKVYLTDAEGENLTLYLDLTEANIGFYIAQMPRPETGLMGIAFHPDFGVRNALGYGKFYTSYSATSASGVADYLESESDGHENVVREWTVTDPSANEFVGTSREIFRVGKKQPVHEISKVAFNPMVKSGHPDYGMLYFSLGDDSWSFDSDGHAQGLHSPLGAMLRIDPLGGEGSGAVSDAHQSTDDDGPSYGIPADNPFVGRDDAIPEIWAYGLRHPQHFSWDTEGRLFIADIGQFHIEEMNLGIAGANYGWPLREGTFATWRAYGDNVEQYPVYPRPECDAADYIYPIVQYDHGEGIRGIAAIGGGFVYRGEAIPALRDKLVFVDIPSGRLFHADVDGAEPDRQQAIFLLQLEFPGGGNSLLEAGAAGPQDPQTDPRPRADARLGRDAAGELYILTKGDGMVRRLVAAIGMQESKQ